MPQIASPGTYFLKFPLGARALWALATYWPATLQFWLTTSNCVENTDWRKI